MNTLLHIYSAEDGRFIRAVNSQPDLLEQQVLQGERGVVANTVIALPENPSTSYLDLQTNSVQPLPPCPSEYHQFDYVSKTWIDPRSLDELRDARWKVLKTSRAAAEFGGFVWDGSRFDSDALSQQRIQGGAQMAQIALSQGQAFSIDWTLADNTVRTLTGDDMIAVGMAMGAHINSCHQQSRLLREQLQAATTAAEIERVVWP